VAVKGRGKAPGKRKATDDPCVRQPTRPAPVPTHPVRQPTHPAPVPAPPARQPAPQVFAAVPVVHSALSGALHHAVPDTRSPPRHAPPTHAELLLQHQLHPDDNIAELVDRLAAGRPWYPEDRQRIADRLYDIRKTAAVIQLQEKMRIPLIRTAQNVEEYFRDLDDRLSVARRHADNLDEH